MKQTALEYLRTLVASYNLNDKITVSVSTLADALQEIDAKGKAAPLTGGMYHLAVRIHDYILMPPAYVPSSRWINEIAAMLTDSPEIIALQQRIHDLERETAHLRDTILHRESVIDALTPITSTGACTATRPNEDDTAMTSAADNLRATNICQHDDNPDTCITCQSQRGIRHHSGHQSEYDSCTHGCSMRIERIPRSNHVAIYEATICPICEPDAYAWRCEAGQQYPATPTTRFDAFLPSTPAHTAHAARNAPKIGSPF